MILVVQKRYTLAVPWWPNGSDSGFHYRGPSSIPGQGTEIPQAARHGQKQTKTSKQRDEHLKILIHTELLNCHPKRL